MSGRMWTAVLALGVAGTALAVPKGGTLYVKVKNTRLMDSSATSANVVQVLQPGQAVTWLGADPKNKHWHLVEVDKTQGVVFQSNLATKPPSLELVASKGGVTAQDATAFANSGAAVKLLADGPLHYGDRKGKGVKDAMAQLQQLKNLADTLRAPDYARHARQAGLFPVVSPSEQVAPSVAVEGK